MTLEPGQSLSHYRLVEKIGEGGMGVVWRAEDTKLSRDVAVKILPEALAKDPQRLARFEREARLLATLNHPNVASIHGLEQADGIHFLVLELVEGRSLAEELEKGPLPVDDALDICRQVAEGLEAAHDAGVIHRDLKPGNVVVTGEGTAKVLDFGLAKGADGADAGESWSDLSMSPTMTAGGTQAGVVLGTAPYMSPEQARGKKVDKRTDVWSFGCVLYECLTGKMVFGGETISDTIALILQREPDMAALPSQLPAPVVYLLSRCLEKDPWRRLRDIGEARIALGAVREGLPSGLPGAGEALTSPGASSAGTGWAAGMLIGALVTAGVAAWLAPRQDPGDARLRRFELQPESLRAGYQEAPVLSPDGSRIAYFAGTQLWVRELEHLEPVLVSERSLSAAPFWSPDSRYLAYEHDGRLLRASPGTGKPSIICFLPSHDLEGGSWGPDDMIYLVFGGAGLYKVPAQGGEPRVLIERDPDEEDGFHTPTVLPDGTSLLYSVHRNSGVDTFEIFADGSRRRLMQIEGARIEFARYSPTGHLIYHRRESNPGIWAVPFSADSMEITGEPFILIPDGQFPSVSVDGSLLHFKGRSSALRQLVRIDRNGKVGEPLGDPLTDLELPQFSPDGKSILAYAKEGNNQDVWRYEIERDTWTRLTFDEDEEREAVFSPDGRKMAYVVSIGGPRIFEREIEGSLTPVRLTEQIGWQPRYSPDGRYILFGRPGETRKDDIWAVVLETGEEIQLVSTENSDSGWEISPDGRFLLYDTEVSPGTYQVYIKPFPEGDGLWQVSTLNGGWADWSPSQDAIYYSEERAEGWAFVSRKIESMNPPRFGPPTTIFQDWELPGISFETWDRPYDVAPGGEGFIFVKTIEENHEEKPSLVFTENWFEDHRNPGR